MGSIPAPRPVFIYGLVDPRTSLVRYVGKAVNAKTRLVAHLKRCKLSRTHRDSWLLGLKHQGLRPTLTILENTDGSQCDDRERYWIKHYGRADRGDGVLTNQTDGGDNGRLGHKMPREIVEWVAAKNRGLKRSAECRALISASNRRRRYSPETRAKISAWQKGRSLPPEHREKIARAMQAWNPSAEARARMSAATKGKPKSAEHRRKISEALKRRGKQRDQLEPFGAARLGLAGQPQAERVGREAPRPAGTRNG